MMLYCGICKKNHPGTYINTGRHGKVNIDCLIELIEKLLDKLEKVDNV